MGIELLSPVGSLEAFKSAIDNGANAIYLAGSKFGAREKATFTNDELVEMIKEAHINEVKVYVTVNTLIYDDELEEVLCFIDFLYNNDCDAIIVQDLGLITLVKAMYPDFEIHASTQMNTMTVKQAQILKNLGVSRIVLARETSIETIKQIKENVDIELEVFVHGALCVSYSGECLFSSSTARKSGNRGECLQLCRLPYSLYKNEDKIIDNQYLLSTKDLNTIKRVNELVDIGVNSLKIEGRLKSGSYVGLVTRIYRKYLDKYIKENKLNVEQEDIKKLASSFNRKFTRGFLFGEENKEITNTYRPNNMGVKIGSIIDVKGNRIYIRLDDELSQGDGIRIVGKEDIGFYVNKMEVKRMLVNKANKGDIVSITFNGKVSVRDEVYKTSDIKLAQEILNNSERNKFPLKVFVKAHIGEKLKVKFIDDLDNVVEKESEYEVVRANNSPTSREKIQQQLSKLNDTAYYLEEITIDNDDSVLIPVSIINECRRTLVENLNEIRSKRHIRAGKKQLELDKVNVLKEKNNLFIKVSNEEQYEIAKKYVKEENIYFNKENNIFSYPRISENKIKVKNKCVLLNELHDIDSNKYMVANCYLNCTNIFTLYSLFKLGFRRVTLSLEMSKKRIEALVENYKKYFGEEPNIEMIIYSKTDLLITKYCMINKCLNKKGMNCGECINNAYYLEDRKGYKIPLVRDYYCNIKLLNPRTLMLFDYIEDIHQIGVSGLRIEFTNETNEECIDILESYKGNDIFMDNRKFTYGYFKDGEEE